MDKDYLDGILSETEKNYLTAFVQNKGMVEAVKKVLTFGIYHNGTLSPDKPSNPMVNFAINHYLSLRDKDITKEQFADLIAPAFEGIIYLERAFNQLENYELPKIETKDTRNPAR